jgi:dipeptidyl aminopeptidase/acylaminoacyl peptidase
VSVRDRLLDAPVPDERGAEERTWRVVRAAHAARAETPAPRRRLRLAGVPATAALAVVLLAASGTAIGHWIRDLARPGREHARPALASLPAAGRLLVVSREGPWVVRSDGSKRLLGRYGDATWSPHGLFVAATQGDQLVALEPGGRVRWTLARPAPVSDPRWSPSGYRIAYRTGPSLRVVAGDGTGDRELARGVAAAPAAWRPGPAHVLAYAGGGGAVRVVATEGARPLWRSTRGERPIELAWSGDGRRLLARGERALRIFDERGRVLRTLRVAATAAAFAPTGHRLAVVTRGATGRSAVALIDAERATARERPIFAGPGELGDLAWSPDGRWLLIGWPSADQWLFVSSESPRRVTAVSNLARQFSPGTRGAPDFPRVAGWCCTPAGGSG